MINKKIISATLISTLAVTSLWITAFADSTTATNATVSTTWASYNQDAYILSKLTSEQKTAMEELRTSLEKEIATLRESVSSIYKDTTLSDSDKKVKLESIRTQTESLKATYLEKAKSIVTDTSLQPFVVKMIEMRFQMFSINQFERKEMKQEFKETKQELKDTRKEYKDSYGTGEKMNSWNKGIVGNENKGWNVQKPMQVPGFDKIAKAVDKILENKTVETQTSLLNSLKEKVSSAITALESKTDAKSIKTKSLLVALNNYIDVKLESLSVDSPVMDIINSIQ